MILSEEGDQWLSFSSESKGRLVDTCLQPTFSYHGVLTLKRVGERSSWLCFRFSGLALLLQVRGAVITGTGAVITGTWCSVGVQTR